MSATATRRSKADGLIYMDGPFPGEAERSPRYQWQTTTPYRSHTGAPVSHTPLNPRGACVATLLLRGVDGKKGTGMRYQIVGANH